MKRKTLVPLLLFLALPNVSVVADELPWVFNAPPADGYSISLVSVDPSPGTPLAAGDVLHFKATVSYTMSISKHGVIVLVFQDEKNRSAITDRPQVHYEVNDSAGVASLADQLTVPRGAKELRVFIPIVPDGLKNTSGEVTIRYPVTEAQR
jgi:hypothetical protein